MDHVMQLLGGPINYLSPPGANRLRVRGVNPADHTEAHKKGIRVGRRKFWLPRSQW